jgi:protein TonB
VTEPDLLPDGRPRRPLRPLHGIPDAEKRDRTGIVLSSLFHGAIILALVLPTLLARALITEEQQGAGGAGPAGGGGGGMRGSGGRMDPERLRFINLVPPAAAPTPPRVSPTPIPVLPPPKAPEPDPVTPTPVPEAAAPVAAPNIATEGTGGGTGSDGTGGNGPGRGGGVGSGEGTGRGSGTGPGTGGGGDLIYPPTVTNLPILPLPVPNRVRPYKMVAQFEVDERGNARLLGFNPSRDSGYNRKIREMLAEVRFRPATRADGTPVRDTTYITAEAPR